MASKVYSAAIVGLDGREVEVECDTGTGLPSFTIVGLADTAVLESRERIRSAFRNSELAFPRGRVTVNLAPANLKKAGPAYDLPIALSVIVAEAQKDKKRLRFAGDEWRECLFVGELALDGAVRPVSGVLAVALFALEHGARRLFVPVENVAEALLVGDQLEIYAVESLGQVARYILLQGDLVVLRESDNEPLTGVGSEAEYDLSHIRGQAHAKRALEIAAAGGHNLILTGSPGSGKTMLARTLATILPSMTRAEMLEVTRIYSVAGLLSTVSSLQGVRPFRSPHHTISTAALVGGGSTPRPGEMSLAHRGVLFLDEFPEFSRHSLEALRQPLEEGVLTVSRSNGSVVFPARSLVVAAMNPCPCGFWGDQQMKCTCSMAMIESYRKKLSGPLLDRFDLYVEVSRIEVEDLVRRDGNDEGSVAVRRRVEIARRRQGARYEMMQCLCNAELTAQQMVSCVLLTPEAQELAALAIERLSLSMRGYMRAIRVARTIADLGGSESILREHMAEALQYRPVRE